MSFNKLKIILFAYLALLMVNCTSDSAEQLYPSNDEQAKAIYDTSLKPIIEEKCISCHVFHLEGANRYDTYEKTKSSIAQLLERINTSQNTKMPPADSAQLTAEEKNKFAEFLNTLNGNVVDRVAPFTLTWTAYKYPIFNDRAPVSGTFDVFQYELNTDYENPEDILKGAKITIDTKSVNVGNEAERTQNVGLFFSFFTPSIEGNISSYTDKEASIDFRMNGITKRVKFTIEITSEKLILKGKIPDLTLFKWQKAHDEFQKVCGAHHQNKLWSDIDIVAEILLDIPEE